MKSKLLVALLAILVMVSMVSAQLGAFNTNKHYALGQAFKVQVGEIIYVDSNLQLQLTNIGSELYDDVNTPNKATISVSHMLLDVAAKQMILGEGEKDEYLSYVVELTDLEQDAVGIKVTKKEEVSTSQLTEIKVQLESVFEAKQGYKIYYQDQLEILVESVSPLNSIEAANPQDLVLRVKTPSSTADTVGVEVIFAKVGDIKKYGEFVISYMKRDGDLVFLKLSKMTNNDIKFVNVEEEFKAVIGDSFNLENAFLIELKSIVFDQGIMYNFVVVDVAETASTGKRQPYLTIREGESASLGNGYVLSLLALDAESAKFFAKRISVATVTQTGVSIQTTNGNQVQVQQMNIAKQQKSNQAEGNELSKEVEVSIQNKGQEQRIRIEQRTQEEATIEEEGVNVRTRLQVNIDGNGIILVNEDGEEYRIKIMPVTASEKAIEALSKNFDKIQLREVKGKIVYSAETVKKYKILGFIKASGKASVDIDALTGEIVRTKKPWYSGISTDEDKA